MYNFIKSRYLILASAIAFLIFANYLYNTTFYKQVVNKQFSPLIESRNSSDTLPSVFQENIHFSTNEKVYNKLTLELNLADTELQNFNINLVEKSIINNSNLLSPSKSAEEIEVIASRPNLSGINILLEPQNLNRSWKKVEISIKDEEQEVKAFSICHTQESEVINAKLAFNKINNSKEKRFLITIKTTDAEGNTSRGKFIYEEGFNIDSLQLLSEPVFKVINVKLSFTIKESIIAGNNLTRISEKENLYQLYLEPAVVTKDKEFSLQITPSNNKQTFLTSSNGSSVTLRNLHYENKGNSYVYWALVLILFIPIYFLYKYKTNLSISFLIAILSLSFLYSILNPPGRVPDEEAHWIRAFEISLGNIYSEQNNLPASIGGMHYHSYSEVFQASNILLNKTNTQLFSSGNALLYSPIPYIPQALAIFIGNLLNLNPIYIYYLARTFNIIVFTIIVFIGLQLIPFQKRLFLFLALMPIAVQQTASISADPLTNSLSMLLIAYFFFLGYGTNKESVTKSDISILVILGILIALCKIVYLPLLLLYFIIPSRKFKSKTAYYSTFVFIAITASLFNLSWMRVASEYLVNHPVPWASPKEQVALILSNPIGYLSILLNTLITFGNHYLLDMVGKLLAWHDIVIPKNYTLLYLGVLSTLALFGSTQENSINYKARILFFLTFSSIVVLILTSLFVQWNEFGADLIDGVQGRYFIPIAFLLFISLSFIKKPFPFLQSDNFTFALFFIAMCVHLKSLSLFLVHHI